MAAGYVPLASMSAHLESAPSDLSLLDGALPMRRKSLIFWLGIMLLLSSIAGALIVLVLHVPEVYRKTAVPAGPHRKQASRDFQTEFCHFIDYCINNERE